MRNTHPSGPPVVAASLLVLVLAYFGSYLALATRHERPDSSVGLSYPLPVWCYYAYHPAHVIDAKIRREHWAGELGITLLWRTQFYARNGRREHRLGGNNFESYDRYLEKRYPRR
jgi:hypothetical protein